MPARRGQQGPLTAVELEEAALRYLNRFDCSVRKLRTYLARLIQRRGGDRAVLDDHVSALIERFLASGIVNDTRFAKNLSEQLKSRGKSRRAIVAKLRGRGIESDVAEASIAKNSADELGAARTLVRKRKLGPHRPEPERAAKRQRDLAVLARAGFDHETARKALAFGGDEDF